jgi:uncharacterized membrane protein
VNSCATHSCFGLDIISVKIGKSYYMVCIVLKFTLLCLVFSFDVCLLQWCTFQLKKRKKKKKVRERQKGERTHMNESEVGCLLLTIDI